MRLPRALTCSTLHQHRSRRASGGLLFNNHGTNSDTDHCRIRLETEIRGLDKLELQPPEAPVVLDAIENPEVVQAP